MNWIDWVLKHIVILLIVAGGIAQWLNKQRQTGQTPGRDRNANTGQAKPPADPDEAERTRRIREEIRRRIEQRRGEAPMAPIRQPVPQLKPSPVPPTMPKAVVVPVDADVLEQQRRIAAELAALEPAQAKGPEPQDRIWSDTRQPVSRSGLATVLRQREGLRRAIVLGEILGPPPGLR